MYIIRDIFIAKPGQASKLAALTKSWLKEEGEDAKVRVMTDLVSDFNQVVMETEVESLAEFEKSMKEYKSNADPEMKEKMSGYTDMYLTGRREIFQVTE